MVDALATGALGWAGYVVTVLALLRLAARTTPVLLVTATALLAYGGMLALATTASSAFLFWPASTSYWFLTLSFLMAFGAIYKSVSLRMLLDLLERPSRADRYEAVLSRYVREQSYQNRLDVLLLGRLATLESSGYRLTPKGRLVAGVAHVLQRLFNIEHSG